MAQGSHSTFGGWEPRNCFVCGKRVLVKNGYFQRGDHNQPAERVARSYHHECRKAPK